MNDLRYRKISLRMWGDQKFRALSKPQPNAQTLWMWLITGPRTTNIPGIVLGNAEALAGDLGWPADAFRAAFSELAAQQMAQADFDAGVVWLPKAAEHNQPHTPNVLRGWRSTWNEVPESPLKLQIWQTLESITKAWGEGWGAAFAEGCRQPSPKVGLKSNGTQGQPSPKVEAFKSHQEQEQDLGFRRQSTELTSEVVPSLSSAIETCEHHTSCECAAQKNITLDLGDQYSQLIPTRTPPKTKNKTTSGKSKRAPANFQPDIAYAVEIVPDIDAGEEVRKFRDHEFRSPRSDWSATWRNWIRTCRDSGRYAKARRELPAGLRGSYMP